MTDISTTARRLAPLAGILAGTAVLGAVASWGAIRAAGDSDGRDTGQAMNVLSTLGGFPIATGGVRAIDDAMEATRDALRGAGVAEANLERAPERYDRSYFNAGYQVPIGPLRGDIVLGRHPTTGEPLATNDIVAHEFAHKVLHAYAPGLARPGAGGDAGAIHESIADTVAMAVDRDDWLIGEDAVPGGMRSFSHPEDRGAYRDGEVIPAPITRDELGGAEAHLGAGVGNKAAWRIGDALGRDAMLRIYVAALERRELGWRSSYDDLAQTVRAAATDVYGAGSGEAQVVDDAWRQAGY